MFRFNDHEFNYSASNIDDNQRLINIGKRLQAAGNSKKPMTLQSAHDLLRESVKYLLAEPEADKIVFGDTRDVAEMFTAYHTLIKDLTAQAETAKAALLAAAQAG